VNYSLLRCKLFGIININKPSGMTSHDVIHRLRKILKIKKIGHAGTLDPMAEGVLPVCIGKATRIIQYLGTEKKYRASVQLGIITDSYDIEGEIIRQMPVNIDLDSINNAIKSFEGEIWQRPPIFSAVHYNGRRLYEFARKNIEITDIPARKIYVNSINIVDIKEKESSNPVVILDVDCSGGTYIRSIAHDLGQMLGYGACLCGLIRMQSGKFNFKDSITIDDVKKKLEEGMIDKILTNPSDVIDFEKFVVNDIQFEKISHGQSFMLEGQYFSVDKVQLVYEGKLVAIAEIKENRVCPVNVFV